MTTSTVSRPWQGTVLGVAAWVLYVGQLIVVAPMVLGVSIFSVLTLNPLAIIIGAVFVGFAAIPYFVARGLMRGKRWSLVFISVISGILTVLSLINALNSWKTDDFKLLILPSGIFVIAMSVIRHPFYYSHGKYAG